MILVLLLFFVFPMYYYYHLFQQQDSFELYHHILRFEYVVSSYNIDDREDDQADHLSRIG
jgi:hypothetical protein